MKNLKLSITVLFLATSILTNAQSGQNDDFLNSRSGVLTSVKPSYDTTIKGNMFTNTNFELAKINDVTKQYPTRYNAFSDNFEVMHDGKTKYIVISKTANTEVTFVAENKVYKSFVYIDKGTTKKGFFVVKSLGGSYEFVIKESIVLVDAQEPKTPYEKFKPAHFKRVKDIVYLRAKGSSAFEKVKLKKKDFVNFFGSDSKVIASLIKKNKINIKKESDLIQLLKLYDNQ